MAAGWMLHILVLPVFCDRTSPLASSTCTCCTTAASDMLSGLASSLTDAGPRLSRSTMRRLLGSDSAWNTRSSVAVWLSMYLTIVLGTSPDSIDADTAAGGAFMNSDTG